MWVLREPDIFRDSEENCFWDPPRDSTGPRGPFPRICRRAFARRSAGCRALTLAFQLQLLNSGRAVQADIHSHARRTSLYLFLRQCRLHILKNTDSEAGCVGVVFGRRSSDFEFMCRRLVELRRLRTPQPVLRCRGRWHARPRRAPAVLPGGCSHDDHNDSSDGDYARLPPSLPASTQYATGRQGQSGTGRRIWLVLHRTALR